MARIILRRVSAWRSSRSVKSSWPSLVTPSTSMATSSPNSWRMVSRVTPSQSSTVSWSRPAAMVGASMPISVKMLATYTGWMM